MKQNQKVKKTFEIGSDAMSREDTKSESKKVESERITADMDHARMTMRWPLTIMALFLLSFPISDLATGDFRDFHFRTSGILLSGLFMAFTAGWGWRVYYRKKKDAAAK